MNNNLATQRPNSNYSERLLDSGRPYPVKRSLGWDLAQDIHNRKLAAIKQLCWSYHEVEEKNT